MNIYCYPDDNKIIQLSSKTKAEEQRGSVYKFLKKLMKDRPDLWALTNSTLKEAQKLDDLKRFEKNKWVGKLKKEDSPIYEFRIPPTKRGGVVRIYFAYIDSKPKSIMLLSAELKHKKGSNNGKVTQAVRRYKEMCK